MEPNENGFFNPNFQMGELFNFNCYFDDNLVPNFSSSSSSPIETELPNYYFNEAPFFPSGDDFTTLPFTDEFAAPQMAVCPPYNAAPFLVQEDTPTPAVFSMGDSVGNFMAEAVVQSPVFNGEHCQERKIRGKKLDGKPSKNLMAERRRRQRLNDRLSMLRSIVPKITKMDRTSILGDTIGYVKELVEKINNLKQETQLLTSTDELNILKDTKASDFAVRNSPKFNVERRNEKNTEIEISCASKPGLLLSTVTAMEALGLEIQQCVISSFNDFALQASCSEKLEKRKAQSCEEIKQALFRSAGYGGRCF